LVTNASVVAFVPSFVPRCAFAVGKLVEVVTPVR
jgi:hypothetical protein